MRKTHLSIIGILLLACSTITAWAVVPPPPVNQNLGIPDTQFQLLFDTVGSDTCKRCHRPDDLVHGLPQPSGIPMLKKSYLPTRHHLHVGPGALRGGLIAGGPEQPPTMDADNDGVEDTHYVCLSCHIIMPIGPDGGVVENHRNCFNCHKVTLADGVTPRPDNQPRTVHHDTPKAFAAECGQCHGYLIRSLDAGRPAPTWLPSIITPWPSNKDAQDDTTNDLGEFNNISSAGTFPGNCTFCHNSADGGSLGTLDDTSSFSDGFGAIKIYQNKQNHHATGVPWITGAESDKLPAGAVNACEWCHFDVLGFPDGYVVRTDADGNPIESVETWAIRGCQRCHDIPSLHAIEADVAGDGIIPGSETPYNGHVGNQDNCWGCHGFNPEGAPDAQAYANDMGDYPVQATVAQLDVMNAVMWPEGTGFDNLILAGHSFENDGVEWDAENYMWVPRYYMPSVQFTDQDGNVRILEPTASDKNQITVSVPADLPAGSYSVQVKKGDTLSNPLQVTILPGIVKGPALCLSRFNVVFLRGKGFNELYRGAPSSVTGITGDGVDADVIYFWRDDMIAAIFYGGCPTEVEVTNVFGSVTMQPAVW